MMNYYELLADGTVGRSTNGARAAKALGLTLATDEEIVYGYDGKRYLKSRCPAVPQQTLARRTVAELESKYNLPRPVRTALLLAYAAGQEVDAQLLGRVREIETAAQPLRAGGGE